MVRLTGESPTDAVRMVLAERLKREQQKLGRPRGAAVRLHAIADACAVLPVLDPRSPDALVGYDEHGLPH